MTFQPNIIIPLIQGDCLVTDNPFTIYTTILGSCVAVCMYDPKTRVGGMVHFLLPGNQHTDSSNSKYGVHSMELLINGLMKLGAERNRLVVKVFGGGQISCSNRDIGILNQKFVKSFLMRERIRCLASDLGGPHARKIRFIPASGRVQHMLIPMFETESELINQNPVEEDSNSIELF